MSGKPTSTDHDAHSGGSTAQQNEDQIDFSKVIIVGVVSLVAFALCTLWAVQILDSEKTKLREQHGEKRVPSEIGKQEIGIVDQVPFQIDDRLDKWRAERSEALNSYGWVDRKRGVAHIPIDKALELLASGAVPAAPQAPAPIPAPTGGAR
ncbi:MAG: hypothetical protein QOI66_664 [Myxococcales bacterium]|jgi:hypothetical protein|nr:hypothetical protein [Myxococcales bacterium]